jgi:hypothetical protein
VNGKPLPPHCLSIRAEFRPFNLVVLQLNLPRLGVHLKAKPPVAQQEQCLPLSKA